MQKAVVFDMDGVLFDSERIVSEIWEELGFLDGIPKEKMQNAIINCIEEITMIQEFISEKILGHPLIMLILEKSSR